MPPGPVAVAVMVSPTATGLARVTGKVPVLPLELVLTLLSRMNVLPSLPEGLEKNWMVITPVGRAVKTALDDH